MHIFNFIRTVLLPQNYEIYLATLSAAPVKSSFFAFYKENHVHVLTIARKGQSRKKKSKTERAMNSIKRLMLLKGLPTMDVCHVQSVYKTSMLLVFLNRRKFKSTIFTYWGSDILDQSKFTLWIREQCFSFASVITVTVQNMKSEFEKIHGMKYQDKLVISRFATDGISCIHSLKDKITRTECRMEYHVPVGKICVTCGYNAFPAQRQDECLKILNSLSSEQKQKIFVIIPMQYGRENATYIENVKQMAQKCEFGTLILEEYVPFEQSVKLAISTDIYLHLRATDAFSNALKEHVYARSYVIKGNWLKYPELDDMGAQVLSLEKFEDLKCALEKLLDDFVPFEKMELFDPIFELYSTEAVRKQWQSIIIRALETE